MTERGGQSPGPGAGPGAFAAEEGTLLDLEGKPRGAGRLQRTHSTTVRAQSIFSSYVSRRFLNGCAILFPMVVSVWLSWWFLEFFDGFFSPFYDYLFGFHVFGLGFITSMLFIFAIGVFTSTWIGGVFLGLGEWTIRHLPLIKHIYSAAKQVSAAVSPDSDTAGSFRECVIIRHPRRDGEFAFAFITGQTVLQLPEGDQQLYCVYVPTNHVYVGDIFLIGEQDIIRSNLSVREGIEIVVSVGMAVPPTLVAARPPK